MSLKHHRERKYRRFFPRMPQNMRGVRANDLIPGRNERIPVYIDGFRRPKFEKKNNYARAESGFCITYSERSQIRRRVLRPVLAETAREHVSRAMSETSASCSLITHVCLLAVVINLSLSMKNQNCTTREQKESLRLRPEFRPKTKKSSGPFVDRFCLFSFFYLITLFLGNVLILIKKKTKRCCVVRKKVVVCLSPVVGFPL